MLHILMFIVMRGVCRHSNVLVLLKASLKVMVRTIMLHHCFLVRWIEVTHDGVANGSITLQSFGVIIFESVIMALSKLISRSINIESLFIEWWEFGSRSL